MKRFWIQAYGKKTQIKNFLFESIFTKQAKQKPDY